MRMVISLLLQNPELVKRMSESGVQALRAEAGFEILEKIDRTLSPTRGHYYGGKFWNTSAIHLTVIPLKYWQLGIIY